jgi:hypothetical protein
VGLWKFAARRKFSGSRHYAKPLGRCRQWQDSAVEKKNVLKKCINQQHIEKKCIFAF